MARLDIDGIRRLEKGNGKKQQKVDATYTVFECDGEKLVQIDMYGRETRENPGKASQVIQFDKETAKFMVELLKREFLL